MISSTVYAAIDIGESFSKLVIGTIHNEKVHICANYLSPTKGVHDGEIISKTELQTTITSLFDTAGKDGYEINEVVLILPSNNMNVYRRKAENIVANGRLVSSKDIDLLKRAVSRHQILEHEMVVGIYPIQYFLDGEVYKRDEPVGYRGTKISLDAFVITLPIAIARGYVDLLQDMDITVLDAISSPLANAALLLKPQEYKNGALILDLGGESNSVSTFYDYLLCSYKQGKYGVDCIADELMKTFGVDIKTAKMMLLKYGSALTNEASSVGVFKNPVDEKIIKEIDIVKIVENALNMILSEVKKSVEFLVKTPDVPLIVTGGGAEIVGIETKVSQYLNIKCYRRTIGHVGGRSAQFNVAVGGLVYYLAKMSLINLSLVQI